MRAALLVLLLLTACAVLVPASDADTPARAARAEASAVTGSLGDYGALSARGEGEEADDEIVVEEQGIVVRRAETIARASRAGGQGSARGVALARRVDLFDGLVTASVARRTATADRRRHGPRRPRRRPHRRGAPHRRHQGDPDLRRSPTAAA